MAEIIDIGPRLMKNHGAVREQGPLRVRLCGPDLRWVGLLGAILAGALVEEGRTVSFADPPPAPSTAMDLLSGGAAPFPGLLVAGADPRAVLQGCTVRTVLLAHGEWLGQGCAPYPARRVSLPLPPAAPGTSLDAAVACAAGAARLSGMVGWGALEQALRQELTLVVPLEDYLILAFETYHRLAAWQGAVWCWPKESG
jgi:hypothetical protein